MTPVLFARFRASSNLAARQFEGRVEHVATGQTIQFNSLDELLTFFNNILAEMKDSAACSSEQGS